MTDVKDAPSKARKAKSAAPAAEKPPEAVQPPPAADSPPAEHLKDLQELSANLAKAAMIAQGALADAAIKGAERGQSMNADPFRMAPAMTGLMGRLAAQPDKVLKAQADLFTGYMNLWQNTARRMAGETTTPVVTPDRGDRRFNDPEWSDNPMFDALKQSYLLSANWLNNLVSSVEEVDPTEKRRVEFFTKLLTDAFSPS